MKHPGLFRTSDHRYYWNDEGPYPGATGIIGMLDKSGPLMGWAKRITAEFAVDNLDWVVQTLGLVGRDQTVNTIKARAKAEKDAGLTLGSKIHYLIEDVGRGLSPDLPPEAVPYVAAYRQFLADYQPKLVSLEHAVLNLTHGYGGTFDMLARINSDLWLIDAKTNKGSTYQGVYTGVYPETGLQLAAYANAEFLALTGDQTKYPWPRPDRFGVLHLRPDAPYKDGYRLIEYQVGEREFAAFLACLTLFRWRKEREASVILGVDMKQLEVPA